MLWQHLPVLIEPVVGLGLNIKRIAEVGWTGGGDPEHLAIGLEQVIGKLLVLSVVVVLHNAEVTLSGYKDILVSYTCIHF